jgi:hypothetical protein
LQFKDLGPKSPYDRLRQAAYRKPDGWTLASTFLRAVRATLPCTKCPTPLEYVARTAMPAKQCTSGLVNARE